MRRFILILTAIVLLNIIGVFIYLNFFVDKNGMAPNNNFLVENTNQITKEKDVLPEPITEEPVRNDITLSAKSVEQADIIVIKVSGEEPSGSFAGEPINFFKAISGDWFSLLAFDAKEVPGEQELVISFGNGEEERNKILVGGQDWPVTELKISQDLEDKGYTPQSIATGIVVNENAVIKEATSVYEPDPFFKEDFVFPLDKIIVGGVYGNIRKSGTSQLQHLGADLDTPEGSNVYAINNGKVVLAREDFPNYGKTVVIDHGLGIFSLYLHLSEIKVFVGKLVERGETIALSGNTGYSLEPHLHFSVRVKDASVDPLKFIETFNNFFQ